MIELTQYFPITNPTMIFFIVLITILFAPIVMGKLRIPHIIGMVLAGVALGQYGFDILERDSSFELFGRVGLLYIMFLAGIEMDLQGLKKNVSQVGIFGIFTFAIPFVLMYIASVWVLGYSHLASVLLSCIMSTNTLIAYPIVARYGLQKHKVTTLSVGASMLSLLITLILVAATTGAVQGGERPGVVFWLLFLVKFVVYCVLLLFMIPRLTRWFLRMYSDSVMQFIFVLAIMFLSAALSELIGLEGIFGAFFSGLILNRYVPPLSPLMNRIEFIGNAIFIPYFLIGVGMLINLRLLFEGGGIITTVICIVVVGTLGKALAAYLSCFVMKLSWLAGHLMFGLTSAHAAAGIAIVMIGMKTQVDNGVYLVGDEMLNGVVVMILFTCIISTVVTDRAARQVVLLREKDGMDDGDDNGKRGNDEKILLSVKYPETAATLLNLAILMRNPKLNRGLIALNVVYDDAEADANQRRGQQLLDDIVQRASAADVRVQTQVRLATNIGNGIKHAFKEFDCSEVIFGVHMHPNSSRVFWGDFAQSVFNGLSRQIIIARCMQPFSTLRAVKVAIPSRAEFEPGFYRWLERLCRFVQAIGCRIVFNGREDTLALVREYVNEQYQSVRGEYVSMPKWVGLIDLAESTNADEMLVVVTARQGTVSYKAALESLPEELTEHYHGKNLMIIFPDQYGPAPDTFTFATTSHREQLSAYHELLIWLRRKFTKK